jgi:hypothetical protein
MATDTKPRTPGTKIPQPQPQTVAQPKAPRKRQPPGTPGKVRVSSPRHTRPSTAPTAQPQARLTRRQRQQRMPFILLLVGLLGGALVSLLVISTTLDEGSYDINNLTNQNTMLYKDEQALLNQVNEDKNPAVIASEAAAFGMRTQKDERFINPSTGAIQIAPAVTPEP